MSSKRKNESTGNISSETEVKGTRRQRKKKVKKQLKGGESKHNENDNSANTTSAPEHPVILDVNKQSPDPNQQNITFSMQDTSVMYPMNTQLQYGHPSQQMPQQMPQPQALQFCSTPTSFYPPSIQTISPTIPQKPPWVDELFAKIENIETGLNKLDQIESLVNSVNYKVNKVERETQLLSTRLDEVEKSTQHISDTHDEQINSIKSLKTEIHKIKCLKGEIDNINVKLGVQSENVKRVSEQVNKQRNEIDQATGQVKDESVKIKEELIDLQIKAMKDNLVFYNIPEVEGEDCTKEIQKFMEEKLKIEKASEKIMIKSVNRIGKNSENIRPILVKFKEFSQRQDIRKRASNLKGTDFGISDHLPAEILKRRKSLLPKLKELRDNNVKAYFVRDKLFVAGKEYNP